MNSISGLYSIRASFFPVYSFVLVDGKDVVLIDSGFWGSMGKIEALLALMDFDWTNVRALILTHGHIDHTANARKIVNQSECKVYSHRLENSHIQGAYHYPKANRWCDRLESLGRRMAKYVPVTPDIYMQDGDILPFWGGLRVVHLPGHTNGHCGFYSRKNDLLFCGDLLTNFIRPRVSPEFLCTAPWFLRDSFDKVAELNPCGMLCSHSYSTNPLVNRKAFDHLYARIQQGKIKLPRNI